MRCPKCGYISFDQEETCAKCSRPLPISELEGTAGKVENYLFLSSVLGIAREENEAGSVSSEVDLGIVLEEDAEVEHFGEGEEREVPMVDLSGFGEEEEAAGPEEEPEQEIELGDVEEGEGVEFSLEEELEEDEVAGESEASLPEPEVKLSIDVDLDDEPSDDELVFNLEDIDESDLVIDEDIEEPGDEGQDASGPSEKGPVPMDLAMEDGELVMEEKEKEKLEGSIELPEIDL